MLQKGHSGGAPDLSDGPVRGFGVLNSEITYQKSCPNIVSYLNSYSPCKFISRLLSSGLDMRLESLGINFRPDRYNTAYLDLSQRESLSLYTGSSGILGWPIDRTRAGGSVPRFRQVL